MNVITLNSNVIEHETETPKVDPLGWLQRRNPRRFDGLENLTDFLKDRSNHTTETVVNNKSIQLVAKDNPQTLDEANELTVVIDGQHEVGLTHWSFNQMVGLAGLSSRDDQRKLAASMVRDNIEWCMMRHRDVEQVKPYFDGVELRAINGPQYGRIHDYEVAEALDRILETGDWVPADAHMGLSVTEHSLNAFLIDKANPVVVGKTPQGDDRVIWRGLRAGNSEVGFGSLNLEMFTFDGYCLNGCIFQMRDADGIKIRHTSGAPYRWLREVQPAIERIVSAESSSEFVNLITNAKETVVADDAADALEWLQRRKVTKAMATLAIERIEAEEAVTKRFSLMDLANGVTAAARSISDPDSRADQERLAGKWLQAA